MNAEPIAFSSIDGGQWIDWGESVAIRVKYGACVNIHAIKFSDGSIFDVINGWRTQSPKNTIQGCILNELGRVAYDAYCEKSYGVEAVSYDDAGSHQKSVATHQVLAVVRELLAILEKQASRTVR